MNAQSPREIELKLELDAADVPRMRTLLGSRLGTDARTSRLVSVYYDTADQALQAAGVTLRIRSEGNETFVQTVKRARGSAATLFDRDEWEVPVAAREPNLEAFAATPAGADLMARPLKLEPVFETVVDRSVWQVARAGSHIEVALDEGRVEAGHRSQPMTELELELKAGAPNHLFDLMREFGEVGSLRPGVLTKSERGYRLLRSKPHRASKAEPLRITKPLSAAEAFQAIVRGCLRHFGLNAPLVVERRSPDALHQARVALRRLRSALSLFKDLVADADYVPLRVELQELSRALGEARNLDVYLAQQARPEAERAADEPGIEAFLQEMERRRAAAYGDVVTRLRSPELGALLLRLVAWTEAGAWRTGADPLRSAARDRPIRDFAARMLEKRCRRVVRQGRHLAELAPEARHRVRIEAKKLRYASEFFAGLARRPKVLERHGAFIAALETLQEALGELNDIQTGHEIAVQFVDAAQAQGGAAAIDLFAASHISGRQDARTEPLLQAATSAHAALAEAKRFWSAWQR